MLLLAILLLLFAAVGLLVAALVTGHLVLAWGSVGVSAIVAVPLLALRRRARRRRREAAEAEAALEDQEQPVDPVVDPEFGHPSAQPPELAPTAAVEEADSVTHGPPTGSDEADDDAEPDEEDTDAADLLVVWELPDEVLVVDEHPRYHLARCTWPDAARTERLPVAEARELGFTPCAQCRPDASLARRRRTASARQEVANASQETGG